jgi:glutamyl-tRNA reductase
MQTEIARYASRLDDLTPDELDAVRSLARGIVAKLLHDPIAALKERSEGPHGPHAKLLAELLGLEPE